MDFHRYCYISFRWISLSTSWGSCPSQSRIQDTGYPFFKLSIDQSSISGILEVRQIQVGKLRAAVVGYCLSSGLWSVIVGRHTSPSTEALAVPIRVVMPWVPVLLQVTFIMLASGAKKGYRVYSRTAMDLPFLCPHWVLRKDVFQACSCVPQGKETAFSAKQPCNISNFVEYQQYQQYLGENQQSQCSGMQLILL